MHEGKRVMCLQFTDLECWKSPNFLYTNISTFTVYIIIYI